MDRETWVDIVKNCSDISMRLVHLTKEAEINGVRYSEMDIFMKIIEECCLMVSTTRLEFICGDWRAI